MTQFVRGALTRARRPGAKIVFVTCDPRTELQTFVDLTIAPAVGPEVIAGSTRLKAGTATKMVLNMLTTASMIRIGKTYGNLMVDVQTGSEKLRDRARRIVIIVTGLDYEDADKLLRRAHWNVKAAIVMQKTGLTYPQSLSTTAQGARLRPRRDRRGCRRASERTSQSSPLVGEIPRAARPTARPPCRAPVGTTPADSVVNGPFTILATQRALPRPVASITIRRA